MPHIVPRFGTLSPDLDVDKTSFGKGRQPQQLVALVNMSSSNTDNFPPPGLVVPAKGEPLDDMSELAHAILDDVFYNIIHDIVLQTHREEKIARASSAAIIVERKAAENDPNRDEDAVRQVHKAETDGAIFNNGEVYLKGNPLKTTDEIRCGKCGLPRLLHPTDGNGAKKADPSIEYCKRRPFIEKKGYDIYGQTFQPEGPGRGKKKQPNPLTNPSNQDSPGSEPQDTSKPINFPHAKCHNCATFLPIKRMNNHMAKCIGGGGRDSSRNALLKIQNGNSNGSGSQYGSTPPGSRNGTPVPASQTSKGKTSPNKRDAEDYDSDESPEKKKKKIIKKVSSNAALAKANKLKAPKMAKSASQHSSSNLSFEQRVPTSDDDSEDGEYGTVVVEPKKKNPIKIKAAATTNSAKNGDALKRKKWLHGRGGGGIKLENNSTPVIEPPDKEKKSAVTSNGNAKKERAASESSQTLSSPN